MKDKVILHIKGLHSTAQDGDDIEMVHAGTYTMEDGRHCIRYEECLENEIFCDNTIKISEREVEFTRTGPVSSQMIFTEGKKNVNYYETPFGSMVMGIETQILDVDLREEMIEVSIRYSIEMNGQHLSDSNVSIKIEG